jgi:hypothetical protein
MTVTVDQADAGWFVSEDGRPIAGPFKTNADAWRVADRHDETRCRGAQPAAQHSDKETVKMSNELALSLPTHLPSFANDGWGKAAEESGSRVIKGDILRFKEGKWFAGKSPIPLSPGLMLAAGATTATWVHWDDGQPTYVPADVRGVLPDRQTLGDTDEATWAVSKFTGKKEDPWQRLKVIYLMNPITAGVMTHASGTVGTRMAINELADKIAMVRPARPGAVPLVKLASVPMATQFGTRDRPHFEVVEWHGGVTADAPEILPPTLQEELNDGLPF